LEFETEMLKFIFKSLDYKLGFAQSILFPVGANHDEYQYFGAFVIQCHSLLKEINTHDSDKTSFPKLSIHVSVGNSKD
jgi:hypothetical protein